MVTGKIFIKLIRLAKLIQVSGEKLYLVESFKNILISLVPSLVNI